MLIHRYVRIIAYWFKVLHSNNCIVKAVYNCLLNDAANGKNNWARRVKTLLCSHGFPDVMLLFNHGKVIKNLTKYYDPLCTLYNHIKTAWLFIRNLPGQSDLPCLRRLITQMRTSGHILRIETGRYDQQRLERFERCCQVCGSGDVEDEFHFVFYGMPLGPSWFV